MQNQKELLEFTGRFFENGGVKEWFGEDWDTDAAVEGALTGDIPNARLKAEYLDRLIRLAKTVRAGRHEYFNIAGNVSGRSRVVQ